MVNPNFSIMKKLLFLFITLALLNSCVINNNIEGTFCSTSGWYDQDILKLDSNNIFEAEFIFKDLGIAQYYCKGKWSYVSKKRIILECDKIDKKVVDSIKNLGMIQEEVKAAPKKKI